MNDQTVSSVKNNSHSVVMGYALWFLGFMGAHRFYYGKQITGTLWFFTLGLVGIGWIIDLFLIPSMDEQADRQFKSGLLNYNIAWLLLAFLGVFGIHRLYIRKPLTGILWLLTGGLFLLGWLYDLWTLNQQVSDANQALAK